MGAQAPGYVYGRVRECLPLWTWPGKHILWDALSIYVHVCLMYKSLH